MRRAEEKQEYGMWNIEYGQRLRGNKRVYGMWYMAYGQRLRGVHHMLYSIYYKPLFSYARRMPVSPVD